MIIAVSDQGEGFLPTGTGPAALRRVHGGGLAVILAAVTALEVTCSAGRFVLSLRAALPAPRTGAA